MIERNPKVKKFDLKLDKCINGLTIYTVVGLKKAYYGSHETDYANGACGLIKQKNYPGYCQLCFVYHTDDSDNYGNKGCTVEFLPLVTKDGERILVKYNHDSLFCTFQCGQIEIEVDEDNNFKSNIKKWNDGTLTFNDNGYCDLWDEDEN